MLYFLYQATRESRELLEFFRQIILRFELPLLKFIFRMAGSVKVVPRHSIHDPVRFNVFMSDLDLTLSAPEENFEFLIKVHEGLKKLFLNLGEIELYTPQEHHVLEKLIKDSLYTFWQRVFLLRKLSWQKTKLARPLSTYEREKQWRATRISLSRLNTDESLLLDDIFPEFSGVEAAAVQLPYYSQYLEHYISSFPFQGALMAKEAKIASALLSVLPDNKNIPQDPLLKKIKLLILERERLLNLTSMRLKHSDNEAIALLWMQDLDRQKNLLLKGRHL